MREISSLRFALDGARRRLQISAQNLDLCRIAQRLQLLAERTLRVV